MSVDLGEFAPRNLSLRERLEAWTAMDLIHEALSEVVPPGTLPSIEGINRQHGRTFLGYAEAFLHAINRIRQPAATADDR